MKVLGINSIMKNQKEMKRRGRSKAIKVVYISSPMKVKTSASEFRALVQELTGKNSDTTRFTEINTSNSTIMDSDHDDSSNNQVVEDKGHVRDEMMSFSDYFCNEFPMINSSHQSLFQQSIDEHFQLAKCDLDYFNFV